MYKAKFCLYTEENIHAVFEEKLKIAISQKKVYVGTHQLFLQFVLFKAFIYCISSRARKKRYGFLRKTYD